MNEAYERVKRALGLNDIIKEETMDEVKTTMRPLAQELGRIGSNELSVILRNGRLEITAHVDAQGLDELMKMLAHYQSILGTLNAWNNKRT